MSGERNEEMIKEEELQRQDAGAQPEEEDPQEDAVSETAGKTAEEEGAGDAPEEDAGGKAKEEKKGFFQKKKDKKDEQIEELTDRLKRTMAEFDNFRKRTEKEKASMYEFGARDIIEKILPVVDNFERGLSVISDEEAKTAFAEGMDKIYRQLLKTLEDAGVKPIEAVGKPFDPDFHNAVMHVDDESAGENIVVEEFQKGYLYRDSVVRHSMVKVAN